MTEPLRVLVCGGRTFSEDAVFNWMEQHLRSELQDHFGHTNIACIIHGKAKGADEGANRWAHSEGIPVRAFPALWRQHGKSAGPIRNLRMLQEGRPHVVVAFPGGKGTANMVKQALEHGVPIIHTHPWVKL